LEEPPVPHRIAMRFALFHSTPSADISAGPKVSSDRRAGPAFRPGKDWRAAERARHAVKPEQRRVQLLSRAGSTHPTARSGAAPALALRPDFIHICVPPDISITAIDVTFATAQQPMGTTLTAQRSNRPFGHFGPDSGPSTGPAEKQRVILGGMSRPHPFRLTQLPEPLIIIEKLVGVNRVSSFFCLCAQTLSPPQPVTSDRSAGSFSGSAPSAFKRCIKSVRGCLHMAPPPALAHAGSDVWS
jgi:hypothetical protein